MKKLSKRLKIGGIAVLGLIAFLLFGNAIVYALTSSNLETRLKALRDAGEPLCLQDLARHPILIEKNAATFLRRARADIGAVSKELWPIQDRESKEEDYQRTEADKKAVRAALEAYRQLFVLLEKAAACPDSNLGLDCTADPQTFIANLIAQVQEVRPAVNLLHEQVRLLVADGKRDEAMLSVLAIFRLARHLEREPMMISHLVVCSLRSIGIDAGNQVLRSGPVSAKARADLDAELAGAASVAAYVRMLKTERAFGMESFRSWTCWWNAPYYQDEQCFYLDLMAQNIALASQTYANAVPSYKELGEKAKSPRHRVAGLVVPASDLVHGADLRTRAQVRCLRVLNALQQKAAISGAAQPKLDDLGLPAEATIDPFNGSPLLLRKVGDEWVIYSVGANLVDDGGQVDDSNRTDVGIGPIGAKGGQKN